MLFGQFSCQTRLSGSQTLQGRFQRRPDSRLALKKDERGAHIRERLQEPLPLPLLAGHESQKGIGLRGKAAGHEGDSGRAGSGNGLHAEAVFTAGSNHAISRIGDERGSRAGDQGQLPAPAQMVQNDLYPLFLVVLVEAEVGLGNDVQLLQEQAGSPCVLSQDGLRPGQDLEGSPAQITKVANWRGDYKKPSRRRRGR